MNPFLIRCPQNLNHAAVMLRVVDEIYITGVYYYHPHILVLTDEGEITLLYFSEVVV